MYFLNDGEIDRLSDIFAGHPILGPATRSLRNLCDVVNRSSDGWAYWKVPVKAAEKLMRLIGDAAKDFGRAADTLTEAQVQTALKPIKAFRTKFKDKLRGELVLAGEEPPGASLIVRCATMALAIEVPATAPAKSHLGLAKAVSEAIPELVIGLRPAVENAPRLVLVIDVGLFDVDDARLDEIKRTFAACVGRHYGI